MGEATIRFRLPPGIVVPELPVPVSLTLADSGAVEIGTESEIEVLAALTSWALSHDVEVLGLTVERRTLEDVYLNLTGYRPEALGTEPES